MWDLIVSVPDHYLSFYFLFIDLLSLVVSFVVQSTNPDFTCYNMITTSVIAYDYQCLYFKIRIRFGNIITHFITNLYRK